MGYSSDRIFTDYIHEKLAIPLIYDLLGWKTQNVNSIMANNVDITNAVDAFLVDCKNNKIITAQERFREIKYQQYSDFTIRYEREFNPHEERKKSEFFKLDADVFVYGIINSSKDCKELATKFVKYVVIDINVLKSLFDEELIIVDKKLNGTRCIEKDKKIICPVNYNKDKSSSFIPIDIKLLIKLFSNRNVIIKNYGF